MGAYLSEPITKKESSDNVGDKVAFGASSMQGWRINQEDAHNCCIDFDDSVSLFAVYDGHGGHEVATYCALMFPEFLKQTEAYKRGDIRQALIDAFLGFDATLINPEIIKVLHEISVLGQYSDQKDATGLKSKKIATVVRDAIKYGLTGASGSKSSDDMAESEDDDENVSKLRREAEMPLDQLMAKYQLKNNIDVSTKMLNENGELVDIDDIDLLHRKFRERPGTSGAGCSSSLSSSPSVSLTWNTNEADVSSSSQSCESTSNSVNQTPEKQANIPGSSEVEQVLDSTTTTTNGQLTHDDTNKTKENKSEDLPDSSADVKSQISPSKSSSSVTDETKTINDDETKTVDVEKNTENTDNGKSCTDNVSSSSNNSLENGETSKQQQQENISSSCISNLVKQIQKKSLNWQKYLDSSDTDDDDENDDNNDDDENDENFVGSDDDTDELDDDDEYDSDGVYGDDHDDPDDDDDDEDEDDEKNVMMNEKPGSDSGCTAVVAVLKDNDLYVANAGDSRCVLCRDGKAFELSFDHKPEDEIEMKRIIKAGGEVSGDGRVNGGLNLSRAIGDHAYKKNNDLPLEEQMISPLPDIKHIVLDPKRDEFLILACDGIWNSMSSNEVIDFVRERINTCSKLSNICEQLFDHCLAPNTMGDGTGCDNMTAVIVKFKFPTVNDEDKSEESDKKDNKMDVGIFMKKRPLSPQNSLDNKDNDNDSTVDCKRAKVETI